MTHTQAGHRQKSRPNSGRTGSLPLLFPRQGFCRRLPERVCVHPLFRLTSNFPSLLASLGFIVREYMRRKILVSFFFWGGGLDFYPSSRSSRNLLMRLSKPIPKLSTFTYAYADKGKPRLLAGRGVWGGERETRKNAGDRPAFHTRCCTSIIKKNNQTVTARRLAGGTCLWNKGLMALAHSILDAWTPGRPSLCLLAGLAAELTVGLAATAARAVLLDIPQGV